MNDSGTGRRRAAKPDGIQTLRTRRYFMAHSTMDNVEQAIDAGDLKASFKVPGSIGVFDPDPPAPTTPAAVEQQMKIDQANVGQQIDRERARKKHLNTHKARKKRYDEVSRCFRSEHPDRNGLKAMDLPEQAKAEDKAPKY